MAKPEDIKDQTLRDALIEADRLLDTGDYTQAAIKSAETYIAFLGVRPDLMPVTARPGDLPGANASSSNLPGPAGGGPQANRRALWPRTGGINLVVNDQKPSLSYDKQRFSFSEASTYFEYVLGEVARANSG